MLFNKLTGRRTAIVEDTPGVTRDRIYGKCEWNGRSFDLVDTGGIEPSTNSEMLKFMRRQAEIAIETADVIIMVTDVKVGVTAADLEVAALLKRSKKPVVVAVNKCDAVGPVNPEVYEFYDLGLGDPIETSAIHGHGTGDLLDFVTAHLSEEDPEDEDEDVVKVDARNTLNFKSSKEDGSWLEDSYTVPSYAMDWKVDFKVLKGLHVGLDMLLECYTRPEMEEDFAYKRPNTMNVGASVRYSLPIDLPLTVFVKGDNLLDKRQDRYLSYRSIGANFLAGFSMSF